MAKKATYINIGLFVVLILILVTVVVLQIENNFLMVNETFALLLVTLSVLAKQYNAIRVQQTLFVVLLVPLFNLLNFSYTIVDGDTTTTYHSPTFTNLISPIVLLLVIVYVAINSSAVKKLFKLIFKGSDTELQSKQEKMVKFYYEKFNTSTDEELNAIYKSYKDYPNEARIALRQIHQERNLDILVS